MRPLYWKILAVILGVLFVLITFWLAEPMFAPDYDHDPNPDPLGGLTHD